MVSPPAEPARYRPLDHPAPVGEAIVAIITRVGAELTRIKQQPGRTICGACGCLLLNDPCPSCRHALAGR